MKRLRSGKRAFPDRHVEIGFVEQRGRAERDSGAAPRQLPPGHPVQVLVQRRKQRVPGVQAGVIG